MKIAYILLSNGLEYDDRIRKEMFSMREILGDVEFKIFAFSGDDNHAGSGMLSYGVPYEFVSVAHRDNKKKDVITMIRREYSFYSQVAERVKDFDLLWCCDDQPFFFPLFSRKPIIWDLHEIPELITGSYIKDCVFHRMEKRCKWLIHANQERLDYLTRTGVIKHPEKNLVLRNYPDLKWLAEGAKSNDSFKKFKEWLGENEYIYIQGIQSKNRYHWETLSSIMESHRLKAVVIGSVPEEIKHKVLNAYPDAEDYIYYTGKLVQSDTAAFIANCKFSMVFYSVSGTPNNRYCEPNRMFQNLGLGKPVIVGCNESMKSVVEKYGNGIVLKSDGSSIKENAAAINNMMDDYENLHAKAMEHKHLFAWEAQNPLIAKLFDKN